MQNKIFKLQVDYKMKILPFIIHIDNIGNSPGQASWLLNFGLDYDGVCSMRWDILETQNIHYSTTPSAGMSGPMLTLPHINQLVV